MADYSGMRRMVAFTPNESEENNAYETSPAMRGEFLNAIRSERNPTKRAVLEDAYQQDFGEAPTGTNPASANGWGFDIADLTGAQPLKLQPATTAANPPARAATAAEPSGWGFDVTDLVASQPAKPSPAKSPMFGRVKDAAVDLATGVVALGESAVGVGDILTFGGAGKALAGLGYDPKATKQWFASFYSDPRQQEEQDIEAADGFLDTLTALGVRPGALIGRIVQSAPGTIGAGAIGGAVARRIAATAAAEAKAAGLVGTAAEAHIAGRIAENTGKIITAATGAEGAQAAGSIAEAGRQASSDWTRYAPAAVAGGAGTALVGRVSAGLARRMGVGDIETDIALMGTGNAAGKSAMGMAKRVPVEMVKEGAFEEMPQSTQEKAFENIATRRPWDERLGKAAAEGLAAGAGMGGGHAVISGRGADAGDTLAGKSLKDFTPEQLFSLSTNPSVSEFARVKAEAELVRRETADAGQAADVDIQFQAGSEYTPESTPELADQIAAQNARRQGQIDTIGFDEQQVELNRQRQAVIDATPETQRFVQANRLLPAPPPADFIAGEGGVGSPSQWHNVAFGDAQLQRKQTIASGLLNHSAKPSIGMVQRLMKVDETMATMLFNHWQGQTNGQVAGNEVAEIPAQDDQGQGVGIAGSRVVDGFSDGAVSFTPGAAAEVAAPGGEPGMALGAAWPDAVALPAEGIVTQQGDNQKVGAGGTAIQPNAALDKLQASYDAAKASGDSFEVQRLAHEINQAKKKSVPSVTPASINASAPYGKVGVAPFSSQAVGLKDNGDGTATVMRGEEPFYDYENGDPVTVKAGSTAEQVRKAVTDAGALSSRDKWFGVAKTETKPAETGTEPPQSGTEAVKMEASIAGKAVSGMPAEQLQKIASGESKTFGKAAVDKAAAELQRRAGEFIKAPDGSTNFGEITKAMADAMGRQAGKIKLRNGNDAEGLRHIELRHGEDVRALGYADAVEFVADVAQRFDAIYRGEGRAWVLATLDKPTGKMNVVLELEAVEGEGDFYDVKNATPTRSDQFKNKKPVWEKEKPLVASTGPSGAPDESGSLNPRDSSGSSNIAQPATKHNAAKEPWQYGELEYGDKYIDEVVLPQLRKELENAHGGRFQEYPSKAAAVRGLKERIDTLENHRDAKARKYYASLDNHYGAVRAALADGKPVPPIAYESYEDLKGDVSAGRIKGDGQEVTRVEQPQHIEAGQAEPATAPVIAASIKESAKNTPMNIEQAREWLLSEIDKAIIDAKSAKEEGIWNRADDTVNLVGIMDVGATIGFKTFNVPGDGKFRVLNLKESLQKFKKQVAATPGFKKNATRPMSVANGSGGKTSVRDMLEDGEYVLAADYGHLISDPLLFGAAIGSNDHPVAYTNAEPVDIKGVDAQVGREWNQTGKSFSWRVIETTTGAMISSGSTKERAVSEALAKVDEHGADKLIAQIKETPKVSQAELERQFTDWGSEEEARAQKTRDDVERADTEDRALWNSIWPLGDGEKRSPNPWNDVDHLQVAILAKDAAKAGKGDEFVSLIERRRGGTNNMLALAARKAIAEGSKPGKQSGGVDYRGFERTPTGNGNFTLKDGNLLVKVEAMGQGKFQARQGSAKSSPHINSEQGAVDWAANLRDASKKTAAYPFYSSNKLFNAEGTAELPKDWTGVAKSDSGKRFFYLSWENGERAYNPLQAKSYDEAVKEAAEKFQATDITPPDGYRKVSESYFGGSALKPVYAPFADGERVRAKEGGYLGTVDGISGAAQVSDGAFIKFDNGTSKLMNWAQVEAAPAATLPSEAEKEKKVGAGDTATVGNTEDAGAELTYNRRNRITRGLKWEDVADKNVALRVKEVTKAKVFPKPDYQALVDDGTNPLVAHLVKQVYDAIATVPSMGRRQVATDADMKLYIEAVNRVMDGVQAWATDRAAVAKWAMRQANGAAAAMGKPTNLSDLESVQSLLDTVYPGGWKNYRQEVILLGGNKLLGALQPGYDEVQRATKDIAKGWPGKRESWQQQGYRVLQADDEVVRVKPTNVNGGYFIEVAGKYQTRFPDKASADQAASDLDPWLLLDKRGQIVSGHPSEAAATEAARAAVERKSKAGQIHEKGRSVESAERTGPARRLEGEDISSDRLKDDFGFRGINFGEWMKGDSPSKVAERQLHLNHAYDAFLDLAEILNVPPKAMSLNGMLGLAIGAQGGGKALAHFVPGVNEINLTRTGGAGALAHEWGHALDHYFGTLAGLEREKHPFLTEHASVTRREAVVVDGRTKLQEVALKPELRPEILGRFKAIVAAMTKRAETAAEAKQRLETNAKRYADHVEGWLRHIRKEFSSATKPGTADMDAVRAGALMTFDNLAARIGNLDLGEGMVAISRDSAITPVVAEMRDAFKSAFGRFPDVESIKALQANIDGLRAVRDRLKADIEHEPQQVATDYQKTSNAADEGKKKPYWSSKLEMFARAFDAFVVDTLAENAAKNSYLAGIEAVPPLGGERKAINAAFRDLVAEIKTKETDKGVALESRSDAMTREQAEMIIAASRGGIQTGETVGSIRAGLHHSLGKAVVDRLEQKGLLVILASPAGLPRGTTISSTGTALYDGKVAYLIADRMKPDTAVREILHEIGEHHGLEGMLGKEGYAALTRRVRAMDKFGNRRVQEAFATVRKLYPEYAHDSSEFMHEVLANIGQDADVRAKPWWQEMLAMVKRWLVQLGYGGMVKPGDIQDMVLHSLKLAAGANHIEDSRGMVPAMASKVGSDDAAANISAGIAAMNRVIESQQDETHAMMRPDHGWVSFVWGREGNPERDFAGGHGIAKIIAKRESEGADGESVARKMVEVIALGEARETYGPKGGERFNVSYDGHTAVLSLHRFGKEETWLLTGWDDVASDGAEAGNASGAYAPESSGIRNQEGADSDVNISQSPGEGNSTMESRQTRQQALPNTGAAADLWNKDLKAEKASTKSRIIGDSGRKYTAEQQSMFRQTGREVDTVTTLGKIRKWAAVNWKQGLFDQFQPVRAISDKGYTLLRLSKGATGAFEAFMNHGKLALRDGAYDADTTGGVMQEVFIPLGKETTDFLYWIAGNRAERLAMEGKERLFSVHDIAAAKSLAAGTTDFDYVLASGKVTRDRTLIYRDSLAKFNAFNKNVMDMAEQSGLIDGASRHLWEHEFYVPFYRAVDEKDGGVRGMNIKTGAIRQEAFKKLKGGKEGLNDLLANTLMNWAHLIDASAKNRAAKETLEAAGRLGAAAKAVPGEKNIVWYMDGGKRVEYSISDPELLVAISSLDYTGLRGGAMDVLSMTKHWLTIGVTASPFFKVRNLIRDSVTAVATSGLSYNIVGNVVNGIRLTNRENQEYVSALAGGGLIRFGTMLEGNEAARTRQLIKKGAKDEHILDSETKLRAFYDKWLEPGISAYNELGNRGEEINRMSLFDQLIKQGVDHATANLMARDLMDFSMQGSWTAVRFLAQTVPFFNARLQGMYKLGRSLKGDPARFGAVLGAVTLFSLALMMAYDDDDDWKQREDWDRDNYWWFKFGGIAHRIPKPFEIGTMATLAERSAELMFNKEMTGKRFREVTWKLLMDQLSMSPVPQLFKPIIDIYSNVDSFTKRSIETMGMERLDKERRFSSNTSMPARGLSTAIGGALSPVQIDHLVRGYFGWLGAFAVGAGDIAVRLVDNSPDRPSRDYWKFATGGMVSELDSAGSRYVTQMYQQAKEIETAYGTWRDMQKQASRMQGAAKESAMQEAADYRKDHLGEIRRHSRMENATRHISGLNERIRRIEQSNLSSSEKRAAIVNINKLKNQTAKRLTAHTD